MADIIHRHRLLDQAVGFVSRATAEKSMKYNVLFWKLSWKKRKCGMSVIRLLRKWTPRNRMWMKNYALSVQACSSMDLFDWGCYTACCQIFSRLACGKYVNDE